VRANEVSIGLVGYVLNSGLIDQIKTPVEEVLFDCDNSDSLILKVGELLPSYKGSFRDFKCGKNDTTSESYILLGDLDVLGSVRLTAGARAAPSHLTVVAKKEGLKLVPLEVDHAPRASENVDILLEGEHSLREVVAHHRGRSSSLRWWGLFFIWPGLMCTYAPLVRDKMRGLFLCIGTFFFSVLLSVITTVAVGLPLALPLQVLCIILSCFLLLLGACKLVVLNGRIPSPQELYYGTEVHEELDDALPLTMAVGVNGSTLRLGKDEPSTSSTMT
jgi:uncharacterized protein YhhL (DUF1145 family)